MSARKAALARESYESVSPNHWSRQEPDGLCAFEARDPVTGAVTLTRGPWPDTENQRAMRDRPFGVPTSRPAWEQDR